MGMDKNQNNRPVPAVIDPGAVGYSLSGRELLELALWLEKSGIEFYRLLSEEAKEQDLRAFFLRLMGMEMQHELLILQMISAEPPAPTKKFPFDETLTHREYFIYLRSLVEKKIFPQDFEFLAELDHYHQPGDALARALQIEEQTIKLFRTLAGFTLPYKSQATIVKLIAEEESHLEEIRKILNSINSG